MPHKRLVKLEQKRCGSQKTGEAGEKGVWLKRLVKLEQKRRCGSQKTGEAGAKEVWLTKDW